LQRGKKILRIHEKRLTFHELVFGAKKSEDYQKNIAAAHRISELFPLVEVTKAIIETFASIKADQI
jgi:tRNA(fMet)-specific endonuclease VapC